MVTLSTGSLERRAREVARSLLPPLIVDIYRRLRYGAPDTPEKQLRSYLRGGKVPWTRGFDAYRHEFWRQAISDEKMLGIFGANAPLPARYGVGLDERCVEYPWLLSRLRPDPERMLDAGSTLNQPYILEHPRLRTKELHILTLVPEPACFWNRGISYLFADLRDIPIRDNYYDVVACLSTLEHVGCDNAVFTRNAAHRENAPDDYKLAMREIRRVLKARGVLFLTVPFGRAGHFGWFQHFNSRMLDRAIDAFGPASDVVTSFYRYTAEGWGLSSMKDCTGSMYVQWFADATSGVWPQRIPVEPDLAAAARAVACVQMSKP